MQRDSFTDKNCYIVGGSSGIGLAFAKELRAQGAHLLLIARDGERLAEAADSVETLPGTGRVATRAFDAADENAALPALEEALESFGPPDLLFNGAGFAAPGRFDDTTAEKLEESFRANVVAGWNVTRLLLDPLRERSGTIINVSSVAGLIGVYGLSDYCTTKFGVIGFSEALRQELAPEGISVHVLCPPDTDTPGFARENRTKPAETKAVAGTARIATAEEVARAALRGIRGGRFLIVPSAAARFAYRVKALAPALFFRAIDIIIKWSRRGAEAAAPQLNNHKGESG